jgi:chaperonin cofactor prefoldin
MELQEQLNGFSRDSRLTQSKIAALQRETRSCHVTSSYLETLKQHNAPLYRSVGKAFIKTDAPVIEELLTKEMEGNTKLLKDLEGQREFLDRRISSTIQNMKDIAGVQ